MNNRRILVIGKTGQYAGITCLAETGQYVLQVPRRNFCGSARRRNGFYQLYVAHGTPFIKIAVRNASPAFCF